MSSEKENIILRPATPADAPSIAHLGSNVFSSTFGYSMPANDLKAYLTTSYSTLSVSSDISNRDISVVVAHPASQPSLVVGFAYLTRGTTDPCLAGFPSQVELQRLYVRQDWHGRGVGKLLMRKMQELARREHFETLWLGVWEENLVAQKVYEGFGFGKVGFHDFVMGSCVQTDWILVKKL